MTAEEEQEPGKVPTDINAWRSFGANLFRRGYRLELYLTRNPKMDVYIRAGYEAAKAGKPIRISVDDGDDEEDNPLSLGSVKRPAASPRKRRAAPKKPAPFTTNLFGEPLKKPVKKTRRKWKG